MIDYSKFKINVKEVVEDVLTGVDSSYNFNSFSKAELVAVLNEIVSVQASFHSDAGFNPSKEKGQEYGELI